MKIDLLRFDSGRAQWAGGSSNNNNNHDDGDGVVVVRGTGGRYLSLSHISFLRFFAIRRSVYIYYIVRAGRK